MMCVTLCRRTRSWRCATSWRQPASIRSATIRSTPEPPDRHPGCRPKREFMMAKHSDTVVTDREPTETANITIAEPVAASAGQAAVSAVHNLAAMRHDPSAIHHLFESGEYPYRVKMRTAPYEAHMLEL